MIRLQLACVQADTAFLCFDLDGNLAFPPIKKAMLHQSDHEAVALHQAVPSSLPSFMASAIAFHLQFSSMKMRMR